MDLFRYQIMEGKIKPADYNKKWWQMRKVNPYRSGHDFEFPELSISTQDLQGVIPPSPRPDDFFDAAAKYHVVVHQSYNR